MKVIIVDDEIIVRAGMRMIIPWESLGFDIAGEAASAEEGIRIAREIKPDLMLVDITMPGMNGIEMIKQLKEELPVCRFIILSCHSEVEYLTAAIRIGVTDYIIKDSLDPEEITRTLKKVADSCRKEGDAGREADHIRKVEELFMEAVQDVELLCRDFLKKIDGPDSSQNAYFVFVLEAKKFSSLSVSEKICEQVVKEYAVFSIHYCTENRILFFVGVRRGQSLQELIAHRCVETLAETFSIESAAGASTCGCGDDTLRKLVKQAGAAVDMRWIRGWRSFQIFLPDQEEDNRRFLENLRKGYGQIGSIYHIGEFEEYLKQLNDYVSQANFIRKDAVRHQLADFAFCVNDKLEKVGLDNLGFLPEEIRPETESYDLLFRIYEEKIKRIEERVHMESGTQVIVQIREYISSHLECKILLQDIADEVHLSRTYISSLFKKETGMNINDYITGEKLRYAKGLLLEGKSISVIVEKTGIQSESYFSKLFRRKYHMTPSQFVKEYRKQGG